MKKTELKLPGKRVILSVIIFVVFAFVIGYIWTFLLNAPYFMVKDVMSRNSGKVELNYLKGRNIFSIDLKKESGALLQYCPDCSKVILMRILPDRLFADFIKRKPVAIIKLNKNFGLDENGAIFLTQLDPLESGLPLIIGVDAKALALKVGKKFLTRELAIALNIILEKEKNKGLKDFKIEKIDVSNTENISMLMLAPFFAPTTAKAQNELAVPLPYIFEVKIGPDNIRDRISILSGVINQSKNDLSNIKYIDLRFKDTVIKFNDVKTK